MHAFTFLERGAILLYSGPNINLLFQILAELSHFVYDRDNYVKMEKTAVKDLHTPSVCKYGCNVYRTLKFGTHPVCNYIVEVNILI